MKKMQMKKVIKCLLLKSLLSKGDWIWNELKSSVVEVGGKNWKDWQKNEEKKWATHWKLSPSLELSDCMPIFGLKNVFQPSHMHFIPTLHYNQK